MMNNGMSQIPQKALKVEELEKIGKRVLIWVFIHLMIVSFENVYIVIVLILDLSIRFLIMLD